jgi:hypothetical protein
MLDIEYTPAERLPGIQYKSISVHDEPAQVDLNVYFEECNDFIDRGRSAGNAYFGTLCER